MYRVGVVTAEPRMEELLASIRKAIHDDIGEVPPAMSARSHPAASRTPAPRETAPRVDEPLSAAAEIQQLRDKINRTRAVDALSARDAAVSASTAQRAQPAGPLAPPPAVAEPPRRSWRDLEPPVAGLRPTLTDPVRTVTPPPTPTLRPERSLRYDPLPERPSDTSYRTDFGGIRHEAPADPFSGDHAPPSWEDDRPAALPPPPRDSYRSRAETAQGTSSILSGDSASAVQSAFNKLAETVLSRATGDRSIEDLTRDLLRGMLKQWLDDNLPSMVERLVREEIERVARQGR